METILRDFGFALRVMRKSPGFTLVAVLLIALGIGVNTAMFSLVDAVLLRPLPFPEPDQLVKITFNNPGVGLRDVAFSPLEMDDLRRADVFTDLSVTWPVSANLTGAAQPERMEFLGVSPGYFTLLGVKPQLGRVFGPEDEAPGFAEAVVISDTLWHRSYGGDPHVLGKVLRLDNDPYTIVGVLPADFRHPGATVARDVEAWAAAGYRADPFPAPARNVRFLPGLIGRLRPGLTLAQAQVRLDALADTLRREYPTDYPAPARWSVELQPLQRALVGDVRSMLLVLQGAVLVIALIAAVNIANLLVARASGRQREIAVRMALGADRERIIGQLMAEAMLLALTGGAVGVIAAMGTMGLVMQLVPASIPRLSEVGLGAGALGFALLLSLLIGAVLGLVLSFQSARTDIAVAIREGTPGAGQGARTSRLRDLLIVTELALAVLLMTGAGLLLRTFWGLLQENPGFNPHEMVAASLWLPVPNDPKTDVYRDPKHAVAAIREMQRRLGALPGIGSAGLVSVLPASGQIPSTAITVEDHPETSSADLRVEVIRANPGYFTVLQTRLLHGRVFSEDDEFGKPEVAVIDQSAARHFWPGKDPLGRRFKAGAAPTAPWVVVIGLIEDVKHDGLDTAGVPHIYRPLYQGVARTLNIVLRTTQPAALLAPAIAREIHEVDPNLPVFNVRTMDDILGASLAARRFSAGLIGVFALLALTLSALGVYGLLAYMVNQREREIGIRMALGARRADIYGLIIGRGALLGGVGVLGGVLLAVAIGPALAAVLYGVQPLDPWVFGGVPVTMFSVALLASYLPARRAAACDPMLALRQT